MNIFLYIHTCKEISFKPHQHWQQLQGEGFSVHRKISTICRLAVIASTKRYTLYKETILNDENRYANMQPFPNRFKDVFIFEIENFSKEKYFINTEKIKMNAIKLQRYTFLPLSTMQSTFPTLY